MPEDAPPPDGLEVGIRRLDHASDLPLPEAASAGSAGVDLRCAATDPVRIEPGGRAIVPTGWILEIPPGWEAQIRPRSGNAWRRGLTVLNAPGTIDSDYRGEVGVLLVNLGSDAVVLERGERIAQMVFSAVPRVRWREVRDGELSDTGRGGGGFGSTGAD